MFNFYSIFLWTLFLQHGKLLQSSYLKVNVKKKIKKIFTLIRPLHI